jgi:hypothetical protein
MRPKASAALNLTPSMKAIAQKSWSLLFSIVEGMSFRFHTLLSLPASYALCLFRWILHFEYKGRRFSLTNERKEEDILSRKGPESSNLIICHMFTQLLHHMSYAPSDPLSYVICHLRSAIIFICLKAHIGWGRPLRNHANNKPLSGERDPETDDAK